MQKRLSTKQLKAIALLVNGTNSRDVAEKLGIRWNTLSRWRQQPEFMAKLEERKLEMQLDAEYQQQRLSQLLTNKTIAGLTQGVFTYPLQQEAIETGLNVWKQIKPLPNPGKNGEATRNRAKSSETMQNAAKPCETLPIRAERKDKNLNISSI